MTSSASALTARKLRRLAAHISIGFVERECCLVGHPHRNCRPLEVAAIRRKTPRRRQTILAPKPDGGST
jgi:hypothetical protein